MKKLLCIPFLLLMLVACQERKTTSTTEVSEDSLGKEFTAIRDTAAKAWDLMIKSDDQKIADMKRLLLEISYCKKYNAMRLDSISKAVDGLAAQRYQQTTMTEAQIGTYDDQTTAIINAIRSLAQSTEELPSHPIAEELYNSIVQADADVVRYRALYDKFAFIYNEFIEKNKEALKSQGELKPLPVFSIQVPA